MTTTTKVLIVLAILIGALSMLNLWLDQNIEINDREY